MKRGKSYEYQYRIMEIITDPANLATKFSNEDGISNYFNISKYSEELEELREELLERLKKIVRDKLTEHQRKIILLFLSGNTQEEIASVLKIHQTGVHKALHGNIDYKSGGKRYGGIVKKLKKICFDDEKIKDLLKRIEKCEKKYS